MAPPRRLSGISGHRLGLGARAVEAALVLIGIYTILLTDGVYALLVWSVLALAYLGVGAFLLRSRGFSDEGALRATDTTQTRVERLLMWAAPLTVSVIGLISSLTVLFAVSASAASESEDWELTLTKAIGVTGVVVAWLVLHVTYARRYEWTYRRDGGTGLHFPECAEPVTLDFVYFALTLGTTFATSDVDVTTRRMRWIVMSHSVIGFFYNAVVLAVALRVLSGS